VYLCEGVGTGIPEGDPVQAERVARLHQSRANPFRGSTTIAFTLQSPEQTSLKVFDASGRLVRSLLDEPRTAGLHSMIWDGRDNEGHGVASGVYFYRLETGAFSETRRMVLVH
jgi:flagellar hook assembly protein FlgD